MEGEAGFAEAAANQICDGCFHGALKGGHGGCVGFFYAGFVERPAFVAAEYVDNRSVLGVFEARFVRINAEFVEENVAGEIAGETEIRAAASAIAVADFEVSI